MKLRAMNGQQSGTEYQMNGMSFTIGREEGNDITIPESSVSRRHCRFLKNGESWTVEDLQSLNGVYVNGMKIKVPTEVFKGDTIRIHESDFRVEEGPERPASMPVAGAPASKGNGHGCAIVIIFLLVLFIICIAVGGVIAKQRGAAEAPPEAEVSATGTTQADDTLLPDNALDDLKAEAPATQAPPPKQESVAAEAPAVADSVEPVAEKPSRRARLNADLPLVVYSNPEGATIYIDKKHYGTTPAVIKELSAGKHTLELSMQGYELFRTQVETPEPVPAKPYRLILKPGVVQINTEPSGAWVWEGRLLKGVTPLIIEDFAEGEHELDIRGPGCERHVESVKVNKAKGSEVNIALKSMLGGIEVTSQPAGCSVYLNGLYLGVTSEASPLAANGILEGRYVVKVEHPSGIYSNAQVAVKRGETARHEAKIWLPTHKLVLNDGREFYGKLADESANGNVVLEMVNLHKDQFVKDSIKSLEPLDAAALKEFVEKTGNEFKFLMGNGGQMDSNILRANDFIASCDNTNVQTFKGYVGHLFRIIGKPTALMKEKDRIVVTFGTKLKCTFVAGTTEKEFEAISDAKDKDENIVLQGSLYGRNDDLIFLTNCVLLAD